MVKHWDIVVIRFEHSDLLKIDEFAERHGLTRSAAVRFLSLDVLAKREAPPARG